VLRGSLGVARGASVGQLCDILSDEMSQPVPQGEPLSLFNTATGESYTFLQRAQDTEGALLQLLWSARPGGRVGEHVHPVQEERFSVVEGELTVSLRGEEMIVPAGEDVAVPPGARHFFANRGSVPVTAVLELRPALRMEQVFETLAGLAREGKARKDGLPRNPFQLAVFAAEFAEEIRGARPPYPVQRAVLPPLAALGRLLGLRGYDPRHRVEAVTN
jgi:quercetin dioxygenase-like cupin family protein